MGDQNFKILEEIAVIGKDGHGNEKRLVKIQWYNGDPVYEVRAFDKNGKALRRSSFKLEELLDLREVLNELEV